MPLEFIPLHKTFAAEVRGVDFTKPVSKDVADELVRAADKYGVLVFRKTGMTDEQHIQFSKHFGDLDDISGYIPPGASMSRRTRFLELFDASNLDAVTEKPLQEHEKRFQYNKVPSTPLDFRGATLTLGEFIVAR
jgi:alpha-ketoglutarate-dependent 2,4-dichlorophenoxyacetate dioxygenase